MMSVSRSIGGCVLLAGLVWLMATACNPEDVTETEVRAYLGSNGGTLLGPRGSRVVVPYGALEEITEFVLIQMENDLVPEHSDLTRRSIALVARPGDLDFAQPVTVQLSYDPSSLSVSQQKTRLAVFRIAEDGGEWERLQSSVTLETNEIRGLTSRLGVFAVFFDPEEPSDGDTPDTPDDLDCSCDPWEGRFCRDETEPCSDLSVFRFERLSETDCQTQMAAYDAEGLARLDVRVTQCGGTVTPVLSRPEIGDCTLSFDASAPSLTLTCGDCADLYRRDADCPAWE